MRGAGVVFAVAIAGVWACGSDATTPVDDGGGGASGGAGGAAQGGMGGASSVCADSWVDGIIEVDPQGPSTQIHGTSAFDGTKIWVAWSRPDGMSLFDNFLAAFHCDGSVAVAPTELTQTDDNELDPVLSLSGERLMAAWISDNGTGVDNLDIRYRIYDLDGTPLTAALTFEASRNGVTVTGNALDPALSPTADGWVMAGTWGHQDAPSFQAFAVAIDHDGVVQGDAQDAKLDDMATQSRPAITTTGNQTQLVWHEETTMATSPTAWAVTSGGAAELLGDPGGRPDVAAGPWYAWDGDGTDITVRPPMGVDQPLGLSGIVHNPSLEVVDGQAAISWMEIVSGIANRVHVARLGAAGELGTSHALGTEAAPSVYPVDLTMVDADHGVVVYQDGDNPDFRVKAELFTLP